eukprot:TRINITY_DN9262_c0_g2_i1.p1 TRINITY_DN9262_c0_g2~~TRINITY_DN9262_c0_g2_i1.p1  ORF type:complete len:451 (-),score=80.54 TRINITY_DN9262_c0_g2_i1:199-1551(-)
MKMDKKLIYNITLMQSCAAPLLCSLDARINSYVLQKGAVYYTVTLRLFNTDWREPWTVHKRFSNFAKLHKQLSAVYSNVPARPKKTFFKMKSPFELNQRRKDLEVFVNKLLANKQLLRSLAVREFFGIDEHVPKFRSVIEKEVLRKGVMRIVYSREDDIVIVVQNVVEDAADPGDKHLIRAFQFKEELTLESNASYTEIWKAGIPEVITCLAFNPTLETFVCGTDAGTIYALKTTDPDNLNLAIPSHSDATTAICLEDVEGYIISAGADKSVVGTSFDGKILYSTRLGSHPLNCITFDSTKSLVLASNKVGEVFLCDARKVKLVVTVSLVLGDASPMSGFVSTGQDLLVCFRTHEVVWYKTSSLEEAKAVGRWKSEAEITSWSYYERERTLLLGNEHGELLLLSLPLGELKAILPCHAEPIRWIEIIQASGNILTAGESSSLMMGEWPIN